MRTAKLIHGHVLDVLAGMPEASVHCCVTSPPYYGLRDYKLAPQIWDGVEGCAHEWGAQGRKGGGAHGGRDLPGHSARAQAERCDTTTASTGCFCRLCGAWRGSLGLEPTVQLYVDHVVQVFRAVWRVLRDDGTCWVNLGDSYAASSTSNHNRGKARPAANGRGEKQAPNGWENPPRTRSTEAKPKDLLGVPWRVALALQDDGWYLRSEIIWNKTAPMPESVRDRPTRAHEHVFLLAKSAAPLYWTHRDGRGARTRPAADHRWLHEDENLEVDQQPEGWPGKESPWKRINLWTGHDYFYDADAVREPISAAVEARPYKQVFNSAREDVGQPGASPPRRGSVTKAGFLEGAHGTAGHDGNGMRMPEKWNPAGRNMRTVWEIGPEPCPEAHFATYPSEIPGRAIAAGTSAAGCCAVCGAPWQRQTARTFAETQRQSRGNPGTKPMDESNGWQGFPRGKTTTSTTGWRPTCACSAGHAVAARVDAEEPVVMPCVVLDPFVGSGRTGVTALEMGRSFVGIDLSATYLDTIAAPAIRRALQAQIGEEAPPKLEVGAQQATLWDQ